MRNIYVKFHDPMSYGSLYFLYTRNFIIFLVTWPLTLKLDRGHALFSTSIHMKYLLWPWPSTIKVNRYYIWNRQSGFSTSTELHFLPNAQKMISMKINTFTVNAMSLIMKKFHYFFRLLYQLTLRWIWYEVS